MNRTQMILGGTLLAQLLLVVLLKSPLTGASGGAAVQVLLPALEGVTPTKLELLSTGDQKVTLVKKQDTWTVEEADGFPADGKKVNDLLDDLRGLKVRRPVVSSSRYHDAFKVSDDEPEARVRIWDDPSSSEPKADLLVGSASNYRTTHVRVSGQEPVYEVRDLASYDVRADTGTWIDKELVAVPADEVFDLSLTNPKGSFELEKQDGVWKVRSPAKLGGTTLDAEKVDSLVRAATSLRLTDTAGLLNESAQGLAAPEATLTLRWKPAAEGATPDAAAPAEPREVVIRVGSKVEGNEGERYITRSGLAHAGTIWAGSVTRLLEEEPGKLTAAAAGAGAPS